MSVKYDRPSKCSPEKDCLWWRWPTFPGSDRQRQEVVITCLWWRLLLRLSERQSMPPQTVLLRTTLIRTIILHRLMKAFFGLQNYCFYLRLESWVQSILLLLALERWGGKHLWRFSCYFTFQPWHVTPSPMNLSLHEQEVWSLVVLTRGVHVTHISCVFAFVYICGKMK